MSGPGKPTFGVRYDVCVLDSLPGFPKERRVIWAREYTDRWEGWYVTAIQFGQVFVDESFPVVTWSKTAWEDKGDGR